MPGFAVRTKEHLDVLDRRDRDDAALCWISCIVSPQKLPIGLYEQLLSASVDAGISKAQRENLQADLKALDPGDSHTYFTQYLSGHIRRAFTSLPATDRLTRQTELANRIIGLLAESVPDSLNCNEARVLRAELLLGILKAPVERPDTPLSASCLMTGTRQDPSLVSQLRKEFLTADRVDVLCSFIKWGGVRILADALRKHSERNRPLRVITTSYMGVTDLKAVDFLQGLPHATLRVSYDTRRTRLHAKAYIFHRHSGFGVAYIGSSNLSQAALTDGLEWNVKISEQESPHLWQKVCATFDTYWNDNEFAPFEPGSRDRLRQALEQERGSSDGTEIRAIVDITPHPYQQEILDKLAAERSVHGRSRNLVVAATGTGKSIIAAFDYAGFRCGQPGPPRRGRLLFIAHREEILKQSLARFRMVLRDHNFGDLLVGEFKPSSLEHLFMSIQSFNSRSIWERVPADFYDVVVIDEFHHAAAPSYRKLLEFVTPKILLGLTATPERMDGLDLLSFFGGHIAAEIRLPDAINRRLLCPFQYFGITDAVDYSGLRWQRGGYAVEDIERLLTGNDIRAQLVISKAKDILLDIRRTRGLGFCVSIRHAEYMAAVFERAGIPAVALSSHSPADLRRSAQRKLISREVNFIFVVDLYNEGVDIPELDTILLLRPTESLTVFLQQLGRGLRLHEDKDCLTVLDFIGQAHQNFNFEARFRALMGRTARRVDQEIEHGLPHLPAGCVVNLERVAAQHILDNIRQATTYNRNRLVRRIASYTIETGEPLTLRDFVEYHRLELDAVYQRGSWSRLTADAGVRPSFNDPDEDRLAKGLRRLAHINAVQQLRSLLAILPVDASLPFTIPNDELTKRFLLMLHFSLWTRDWRPESLRASVQRLCANPTMLAELRELLAYKLDVVDEMPTELTLPFLCPVQLHADYTRDEILAAFNEWNLTTQREFREGGLFIPSLSVDLLFVTLNKTEDEFSPTTMYEDYAVSDELFHWQTQSTTSDTSPTGQRFIHHEQRGGTVLLFVREDQSRNGLAMPYTLVGPVSYVSHTGSRPMSIIWKLSHKLPAKLLPHVRRLSTD